MTKSINEIDFSPLDEKSPKRLESSNSTLTWDIDSKLGSIFTGFILFNIAVGFAGIIGGVLGMSIFVVEMIFVWWFVRKHVYNASLHVIRLSNFSIVNKFHFYYLIEEWTNIKGVLRNSVGKALVSSRIEGKLNDLDFNYYNLLKVTRKGFYSIFEVKLNQSYPHILLDSHANKKISANIEVLLNNQELNEVEHQFTKHFSVYSNTTPTATLQVIEPSLMQAILDRSAKLDIEIVEDKLYLIFKFGYPNGDEMKYIFEAAKHIVDNLDAAPLV